MNAWLIYWVDPPVRQVKREAALVKLEKLSNGWEKLIIPADWVVAIVKGQRGSSYITELVELLYANSQLDLEERLNYAKHRGHTSFPARRNLVGNVTCGSSKPFLVGVLAYDLPTWRIPNGVVNTLSSSVMTHRLGQTDFPSPIRVTENQLGQGTSII